MRDNNSEYWVAIVVSVVTTIVFRVLLHLLTGLPL